MTKKYPRSEAIQEAQIREEMPSCISWDGPKAVKEAAFAEYNKTIDDYNGFSHTNASVYYDYRNLDGDTSGRPGLKKRDYYQFRPNEAPPSLKDIKKVIHRCDHVYQSVGLIRNIIDLMGDFACQGIRISHPNKKIQQFYRTWFAKVNAPERSERFCNNLFRTGNLVVRKYFAKINIKVQENFYRATATPDLDITIDKVVKKEIPFKYAFLEPTTIDVVAGKLSSLVGKPLYTVNLSAEVKRIIKSPKNESERAIISKLPEDILASAKTSKPYLLPPDKVRVFHYKKDDWQTWASPMIYAILDDIAVLEKLRLADMAALDGAISNIRIFKIGNLEYKIAPSRAAAVKLASILQNNVGGGTIDLIWGPDIELIESKTTIHQFLGSEKYGPHLSAIYNGLGIPPSLTGNGNTGTTNNYISLKTLIQRLQYVRNILLSFWNEEIAEVQKAMGFKLPAKIEFDIDILDDTQAVRALLIQLADRNIISDELLQSRFGHDSELENSRIISEQKDRESGRKVNKAGPYHDAEFGLSLKKIALQTGTLAPGQVGLKKDAKITDFVLYDKTPGEKTALELRSKPSSDGPVKNGTPGQGRPKNVKDSTKRKTKTFKPKLKASAEIWVKNAQESVSTIIGEIYLEKVDKTSLRKLTSAEVKEIEKLKFGVLFNIEPMTSISNQTIYDALNKDINNNLFNQYQLWINTISQELDRVLTLEEQKQVQLTLYNQLYIGE